MAAFTTPTTAPVAKTYRKTEKSAQKTSKVKIVALSALVIAGSASLGWFAGDTENSNALAVNTADMIHHITSGSGLGAASGASDGVGLLTGLSTTPVVAVADTSYKANYINHPQPSASASASQRAVVDWLSKKYRISAKATSVFVSNAYNTAHDVKLDPLLILAVIAIESGFNPYAESSGGAQGLMQVMYSVHQEKFEPLGGVKMALNPAVNIKVGAGILKDYVVQSGSVREGLKRYVGAAAFANDSGYGYRVLAEYDRLKGVTRDVQAKTAVKPASPGLQPFMAQARVINVANVTAIGANRSDAQSSHQTHTKVTPENNTTL